MGSLGDDEAARSVRTPPSAAGSVFTPARSPARRATSIQPLTERSASVRGMYRQPPSVGWRLVAMNRQAFSAAGLTSGSPVIPTASQTAIEAMPWL